MATKTLQGLSDQANADGFGGFYPHGMDVYGWVSGSRTRPPVSYLAGAPLSLPLIGLTQLLQLLVSCRCSGLTPAQLKSHIRGTTGHSQGIISAVVLSAAESFESLQAGIVHAVQVLFHIGKRGQEMFPVVTLEPALFDDAMQGGEGSPTRCWLSTG